MKICVCSDIHGNGEAFKAFLKDLEKQNVDLKVFCGDILGYYYDANEIITYFREHKDWICLLGNHDDYFLKLLDGKIEESYLIQKYGNSYKDISNKVSKENIDFLRKLEPSKEMNIDGLNVAFYHGGPNDHLNQRMYPDYDFASLIHDIDKYDFVFFGHTHHKITKQIGKTILINPGSIGQQRDGKGTSYIVFDTDTKLILTKTFDYNIEKIVETINKNEDNEQMKKKLIDVLLRQDII